MATINYTGPDELAGDRTVLARATDGEVLGFGGVTPIEE